MDTITIQFQWSQPMEMDVSRRGAHLQTGSRFTSEQGVPNLSSHYLRLVNERILQKHLKHRS
jgi:hypothetical protein